jgi:DNA-binding beta-propeller fold protein YncE
VLPQLRKLEHQFADAILVVGVHSGKYIAERETGRIREAAIRLDNAHPIVNDRQFRVWRSYAVRAWPTLVVVDSEGRVLGQHAGEFTAEMIAPFLERAIADADQRGILDRTPRRFAPDPPAIPPSVLRYPGKVAADGKRLAIADSGHHRVIVGDLEPDGRRLRVRRIVGGPARGFVDGASARFDYPQGLIFDGDTLFVADAGNHALRALDLTTGTVRTVAGTGTQLRSAADQRAGALSSPWDVTLADGQLYVAMAGVHQIWAIDPRSGRARTHSGTFREDIIDGPHPSAALAQPMGIARAGERIYFADAESSALRWADLDDTGNVGTLVGTGLFDFGDVDGVGDRVRMQHQQGLAWHPSGRLLVADSYNDALKWVDPSSRAAETWLRDFHEPGGLALAGAAVYVADTNAHRIAVVREATGEITTLELMTDE